MAEVCTLPLGIPEEGALFDVGGFSLTRFLLREKNDVAWEGILEALDAVDVIEDFLDNPVEFFSFDSGAFSAERKPKAPLEAMAAASPAKALVQKR